MTEKRKQAAQVTDLQNIKGQKDHDEIIGRAAPELRNSNEEHTLISKWKGNSLHSTSLPKILPILCKIPMVPEYRRYA